MTSCRRLLGLGENVGAGPAGGVLSIDMGSRLVTLTVSHVGIDRDVWGHRLRQQAVAETTAEMRRRYAPVGRKVVGGLEMLNALQGADLKLLAYEELLSNYPMWRSRLTMLQVCFADRDRPAESAVYCATVRKIAARIASAFGEESITLLVVGDEATTHTVTPPTPCTLPRCTAESGHHVCGAGGYTYYHIWQVGDEALPSWTVNDRLSLFQVPPPQP